MTKIGVLGAGAFGSSLAAVFAAGGHDVTLWGRNVDHLDCTKDSVTNTKYLGDIPLPASLGVTSNLDDLANMDMLLVVIPSQQLSGFLGANSLPQSCPIILCAKGVERETTRMQTAIAESHIPNPLAVLTGPGFAHDIAMGKPTAMTLATSDADLGAHLQQTLSTQNLRLYLSDDMIGAQLGGALKNVYAIACGIVIGAGLGDSARAALLTRSFAEMSRLAAVLGAKPETLSGLSGFGDLVLTATSPLSRNFSFGLKVGTGQGLETGKTVEGIATAQGLRALAHNHHIEMPIADTVAEILAGRLTVTQGLGQLMSRPLKKET
jgi:glycerol-3-phosphate dehydrogenase (NAD(P)+)